MLGLMSLCLVIYNSGLVGDMGLEVGKQFSSANLATVEIFGCHEPLKTLMIYDKVKPLRQCLYGETKCCKYADTPLEPVRNQIILKGVSINLVAF